MFTLGKNTWNGLTVICFDIRQEESSEVRQALVSSGGVFVTQYSEATLQSSIEVLKTATSESVRCIADALIPNEPVMFVNIAVQEELTIEEFNGLLFHEQAHILNGDVDEAFRKDENAGLVLNQDYELKADAYAASKVGKDVLKSALTKVMAFAAKSLADELGLDYDNMHKAFMENPGTKERLEALSN